MFKDKIEIPKYIEEGFRKHIAWYEKIQIRGQNLRNQGQDWNGEQNSDIL